MNRQTIFSTAYLGIIAQGGPSIDPITGGCAYRGPNGKKCSIGHLFPDSEYNSEMENISISDMIHFCSSIVPKSLMTMVPSKINFLHELQLCHDSIIHQFSVSDSEFIYKFKEKMAALANKYSLEIPNTESPK